MIQEQAGRGGTLDGSGKALKTPVLEPDAGMGRMERRRLSVWQRRLSWLSWILIVTGLLLILTPALQTGYSMLVQARLRAALEQEMAGADGEVGDPQAAGSAAVGGLVGLADRVFDTIDPIFSRAEDDPTLAGEGVPGLPTREILAGPARIIIEKADVDAVVVDGTTVRHLRRGPGFYREGSLPNLGGNVAIAGHRTTYGAWFRHLDRLEPGDLIQLVYKGQMYNYEVQWVRVIAHNDWSVIDPTGEHVLTLTTCHPPGSSAYRLAVRARFVGTSELPRGGIQ